MSRCLLEEPKTILVVDDVPDTLEMVRRSLALKGHRVLVAASVARAVELVAETPIDLVITDLKMPGAGGAKLIRHLRKNYPRAGIMIMTGYPIGEDDAEILAGGAQQVLAKPFTDEELEGALKRALAGRQRQKSGRRVML